MSYIFLTESQLHNLMSGKNKAFMTRTINKQKKYGNTNIFSACISTHEKEIRIELGEGSATFKKDYYTNKWEHDFGYLTNVKECTDIVNELATKINFN